MTIGSHLRRGEREPLCRHPPWATQAEPQPTLPLSTLSPHPPPTPFIAAVRTRARANIVKLSAAAGFSYHVVHAEVALDPRVISRAGRGWSGSGMVGSRMDSSRGIVLGKVLGSAVHHALSSYSPWRQVTVIER
jgi:hypothetical protein